MTSRRPVSVRASLTAVSLASEPLSPSSTRSRPGRRDPDERLLEGDAGSLTEPDETWLAARPGRGPRR